MDSNRENMEERQEMSVAYDGGSQLGTMVVSTGYVVAQPAEMIQSPYVVQPEPPHTSNASATTVQYVLQDQGEETPQCVGLTAGQQVLSSELIPGATLPTEFLQFPADQSTQDTDKQRKEILIGDVFDRASATLSEDFLNYVTLTQDGAYLETIGQEFNLVLQQSTEALSYHGKVDALRKLEQHFMQMLFGPMLPANSECKETQTDDDVVFGGDAKLGKSREDKSVMCDIPRPVFSRSGRQFKLKAELYENEMDDATLEPAETEATKPAPKSTDKPVETAVIVTGRKRGRPPKKKPKMIHVAEGGKNVTIRDSATGEAVISETGEAGKEIQTESTPLPVQETETSDTVKKVKQEEEKETAIPEKHRGFFTKSVIPSKEFTDEKQTERNIKRAYEDKMPFKYYCDICSFKTKRKSHLEKHKEIHKSKKLPLFHCDLCSFTTMRSGHLSRHLLKHSENVLSCKQCNYKTINRGHLHSHMKKKHNVTLETKEKVEVVKCEICGYKTQNETNMKRHLRSHDDGTALVQVFECRHCPYKTPKKVHYSRHMVDVHSEKRPYLCDTCGRGFKRNDALRQHRQVHVDKSARQYPYYCECGKGFRTPAHLKEHMTIHSTARPFLCEICGACFKTKSVQRKHTATLHRNPHAHHCRKCPRRFNTAMSLRRHLRAHGDLEADDNAEAVPITTDDGTVVQHEPIAHVTYDENVVTIGGGGAGQENMVVVENNLVTHGQEQKHQEYVIETVDRNTPLQSQVIAVGGGTTTEDQIVQIIPEPLYLQQGSTVQIVTQNEMGGVEQVQMVMIQPGDSNTQIIENGQGGNAETILYLTGLPNMQTAIQETG